MASGLLTPAQLAGLWIAAGGPPALADIMAAVAQAESGGNPGAIQQGEPYDTTGWGLWQITPGGKLAHIGVDFELLNPITGAHAAVAVYKEQGLEAWATWNSGAYRQFYNPQVKGDTTGVQDVEYVPTGPAPEGTHNSWTGAPPPSGVYQVGVSLAGVTKTFSVELPAPEHPVVRVTVQVGDSEHAEDVQL